MREPVLPKAKATERPESHHWWPECLSRFWKDDRGLVHQISSTGEVVAAPPAKIGALRDAHRINRGKPWDHTFEPIFGPADSSFPHLVEWLANLVAPIGSEAGLHSRIGEQPMTDEERSRLVLCVTSLVARSPSLRDRIRVGVEYYRQEFGLKDWKADKNLIAANQHHLYQHYLSLMRYGPLLVFFSDNVEFIFGDGFLHNFPTVVGTPQSVKLICPITPSICVAYARPSRWVTRSAILTMRLEPDEVATINETVQVYSKRHIFYRSQRPTLSDDFRVGEHLEYTYHRHRWLDHVMYNAAMYRIDGGEVFEDRNF